MGGDESPLALDSRSGSARPVSELQPARHESAGARLVAWGARHHRQLKDQTALFCSRNISATLLGLEFLPLMLNKY